MLDTKEYCVRAYKNNLSAWKLVIFEGTGETHLASLEYTPLYEKGIKKTQNKPMETTDMTKQECPKTVYLFFVRSSILTQNRFIVAWHDKDQTWPGNWSWFHAGLDEKAVPFCNGCVLL